MPLSEKIFCYTPETPVQTTNFIDDHSLEQGFQACRKKFSQIGLYVIPFDSSRRAESNGVTFSLIGGGRNFDQKFSKYRLCAQNDRVHFFEFREKFSDFDVR